MIRCQKFLDFTKCPLDTVTPAGIAHDAIWNRRVRFDQIVNATLTSGDGIVPQSILDAIKSGNWNYDPDQNEQQDEFDSTNALPGSGKKLEVLADRIQAGLPLWHPEDRLTYGAKEEE